MNLDSFRRTYGRDPTAEELGLSQADYQRLMAAPVPAPMPIRPPAPTRVIVTDLDMPFFSMVGFMIKWAIAAIPAAIILGIIFGTMGMAFVACGAALGGAHSSP